MKAIICRKYGGPEVLELTEVEEPTPQSDEVLIRVCATSINSGDQRFMRADPFFVRFMGEGFFGPKKQIPGNDMSGVVEEVGRSVTKFKPGDEVFGDVYESGTGAFAEYVSIKEDAHIVPKPSGVTFEQAAASPVAGLTALQALRNHGQIKKGQKVLVNGASGSVGTFTVIIAKALGAQVTGVCSARNAPLVRDLGADDVIDYTKEDFKQRDERYDLIIDIAANITPKDYVKLLNKGGTGLLIGLSTIRHMMGMMLKGKSVSKKHGLKVYVMGSAKADIDDLKTIGDMIASGKIAPAIERVYSLEETREAMRCFEEEHARAKLVIKIS